MSNPVVVYLCRGNPPRNDNTIGERSRGNTRGNRTESLREENLPLRGSPRGPPKTSERYLAMKIKSQKRTFRRFSQVLSETLSEEDFPLGDSRSCCP